MIDAARDDLIDLHKVAKRFGRTYDCIRGWVRTKQLEAIKIGSSWYTTADAINAMAKIENDEPAPIATASTPGMEQALREMREVIG